MTPVNPPFPHDPMIVDPSDKKRPAPVQLSYQAKKRARTSSYNYSDSSTLSILAKCSCISKAHAVFFNLYLQSDLKNLLSTEDFPNLNCLSTEEAKTLYKQCYLKHILYRREGIFQTVPLIAKYDLKPFSFLNKVNSALKIAFEYQPIFSRKLVYMHESIKANEILDIIPVKRQDDFNQLVQDWTVFQAIDVPALEPIQKIANQMESISDYDISSIFQSFAHFNIQTDEENLVELYGDLLDLLVDFGDVKAITVKFKTLKEISPFTREIISEKLRPYFEEENLQNPIEAFLTGLKHQDDRKVRRLAVYLKAINLFNNAYETEDKKLDKEKHAIACAFAEKHKITY